MSYQRNTLFRYLTLLQLIPRSLGYRATATLQALPEERGFHVDQRRAQRDLEKMSNDFSFLCDKSQKPYRFPFALVFKSKLQPLNFETALTFVFVEEYLKGLFPQEAAIVQLNSQFAAARTCLEQLKVSGFSDRMRHEYLMVQP